MKRIMVWRYVCHGLARCNLSRLNCPTLRDFALAWAATPLTTGLIAAIVVWIALE